MVKTLPLLLITLAGATASSLEDLALFLMDGEKKVAYELQPETKYIAFYQSASWCPPCRKVTPLLVKEYQRMLEAKQCPVEIVLIGEDRSEEELLKYMNEYQMKWPAVEWNAISALGKFRTQSIPHLAVVELSSGQVVTKGDGVDGIEEAVKRMREFSGVSTEESFDDSPGFMEMFGLSLIAVVGGILVLLFLKWRQSKRSGA